MSTDNDQPLIDIFFEEAALGAVSQLERDEGDESITVDNFHYRKGAIDFAKWLDHRIGDIGISHIEEDKE